MWSGWSKFQDLRNSNYCFITNNYCTWHIHVHLIHQKRPKLPQQNSLCCKKNDAHLSKGSFLTQSTNGQCGDHSATRGTGNLFKLSVNHCRINTRKIYFSERVVKLWNSSPSIVSLYLLATVRISWSSLKLIFGYIPSISALVLFACVSL